MAAAEYRSAAIELRNVLQVDPDRVAARVMLADASFLLNDMATAEAEYRKALALDGTDVELWAAYGKTLLVQGKAVVALEQAAPDLAAFPDSAIASAMLGDIQSAFANVDTAQSHYARALVIDAHNVDARIGSALIEAQSGDPDTALDILDAGLEMHPRDVRILRAKADVHGYRRDYNRAIAIYDQAIDAESIRTSFVDRFVARQNRLVALIEARRFDVASRRLEEFRTLVGDHPLVHFYAGRLAFASGDFDVANDEMLRYLAVVPGDPRGQAILGAINFSRNNLIQAERYLSSAIRGDADSEMTRLLLAETQLRLDRPRDVIDSLETAGSDAELSAVALAMLGRARFGDGDVEGAIEHFRQSLERGTDDANVNLALATSLIAANRFDEAIEQLTDMSESPAGDYRREMLLMSAFMSRGDAAQAEAIADELIASHRDDADANALAGILYANLSYSQRARIHLTDALRLAPDHVGAHFALGLMAVEEDRERSIEHFGAVLDAQPANVPALIQLSAVQLASGDLQAMASRLQAAREAAPTSGRVRKLAARIELMLGDVAAAQADIDAGREAYPDDPSYLHLQGLAQVQSGNLDAAVSSLSRAARAMPDNPTFQFDLARVQLANRAYAGAASAVRSYRELRPDDIRGLALEVDATLRSEGPARAVAAVDAFRERYPDEDFLLMLDGDIAMARGDPDAAVRSYEDYAAIVRNRTVVTRLAGAYRALESQRALRTMERWLEDNPQDAAMRVVYAQLLEEYGDTAQSIVEYERLEGEHTLNAAGLNNLAWQYMQAGQAGARQLAERAHDMEPDNGNITDTLGWILYREGELARAVELLDLAHRQAPDNAEIQFHLAAALSSVGRNREAKMHLDELLASGTDFPSLREARELAGSL